jgi:cell division protein FtsB
MILRRTALIVVHLALAAAVLGLLVEQRRARAQAVADLRTVAEAEARETARMQRDHAVEKAQLDGLRQQDPYVVEYLARERLGYGRAGEIAPPPPAPAAP